MHFTENSAYHIYNRSFGREKVFTEARHCNYFIHKLGTIRSIADILAYCIMPDHFHIMVYVRPEATTTRQTAWSGQTGIQRLSRKIGTVLSSFTQGINKERGRKGSLFQPKTKAKELAEFKDLYACFHYIHQNPLKARLCNKLEDWPYSSIHEFISDEKNICSLEVAYDLLDLPTQPEAFLRQSYSAITFNFDE
ncbi:MAG: transposase [Cyclobacteriaceae bacterium]|jgi:putative transposase